MKVTLEELHQHARWAIEEQEYALKRAKSPKTKRVAQSALAFWKAIKENLKPLD